MVMANGFTYGINFPFRESFDGKYLDLSDYDKEEIRSNLIHLILTRKGSRYFLPDFGTRLYEFLFEPFDGLTFNAIEADIRDSVSKYIPNLLINNITIEPADPSVEVENAQSRGGQLAQDANTPFRVPGKGTSEYTAKVRIDFSVDNLAFAQSDFVILNI